MQREVKKMCIFQRLSSHLIRGFRDFHSSIKLCRALCLPSGCWCVWTVFLNDKVSLSLLKLTPADGGTHWILCPLQRPWFPRQTDGRTDTRAHTRTGGRAASPGFSALFTHLIQIAFLIHQVRVTIQPRVVALFFFEAGRIGEETPIIRLREASLRY